MKIDIEKLWTLEPCLRLEKSSFSGIRTQTANLSDQHLIHRDLFSGLKIIMIIIRMVIIKIVNREFFDLCSAGSTLFFIFSFVFLFVIYLFRLIYKKNTNKEIIVCFKDTWQSFNNKNT